MVLVALWLDFAVSQQHDDVPHLTVRFLDEELWFVGLLQRLVKPETQLDLTPELLCYRYRFLVSSLLDLQVDIIGQFKVIAVLVWHVNLFPLE
jgi:hypothetical protein